MAVTPEQRDAVLADLKAGLISSYSRTRKATEAESDGHYILQFVVAWGELLGGAAVLLGLLTRWTAAGLIVVQLGAVAALSWVNGFSFEEGGGYEFNFAVLILCLALIVAGAGALSMDNWLSRLRRQYRARTQRGSSASAVGQGPVATEAA